METLEIWDYVILGAIILPFELIGLVLVSRCLKKKKHE